ncbi:TPA: PefC/AfrB family outer membrane usher protein [Salmonella enterica]|nr:PefC/AfrB family outer membrane usher protein [Salmonella enterica]
MSEIKKLPSLSVLALGIMVACTAQASDDSDLNLEFLQGVKTVPAILQSGKHFPAGYYFVDVRLNKEKVARTDLTVTPQDEKDNTLCLSPQWLKEAGIYIREEHYRPYFDMARQCYVLSRDKDTKVDFNYGMQSLNISVPQAWLLDRNDAARWDYGVNGLRLAYSGNFSKTSHRDVSAYGAANWGLNVAGWTLSSQMNVSHSQSGNTFSSNSLLLSRPLAAVKGDLLMGRTMTRNNNLFSDFGFNGVALRSNNNMKPQNQRGYAPVISGVAASTSRITVSQNGYTIYSKVVPAGPWQLNDISSASNGDLTVTVEDEAGRKTTTVYPVATLPTLLRPGDVEYSLAVGERNSKTEVRDLFNSDGGVFGLLSGAYGFNSTTLSGSALIHGKYQAAGMAVTQSLGSVGAVSATATVSKARYDNGESLEGRALGVKFAKSFSNDTDIQLLTWRYQSKDYIEFAGFDSKNYFHRKGGEKTRYEARLSHRLSDSIYAYASLWQANYWDDRRPTTDASLSLSSTVFDDVSLNLSGAYRRQAWQAKDDYSASLSVNIPLGSRDGRGTRYYSNTGMGYSSLSGTTASTSMSATVNERLSYRVGADTRSRGNTGASASVTYAFDRMNTGLAVSQNRENTTVSGNLGGSVLATAESGVVFSRQNADTVGIARIDGIEGVRFNSSRPSDRDGNAVMYLSPYTPNDIRIRMDNVPDDIELKTTSYSVVPTEKAIIYRKFGFEQVKRYVLQVRDRQGNLLSGGGATTEQGLNAGFVSNQGVLVMNMLAPPQTVTVQNGEEGVCRFSMAGISPNTSKVQEVRCE